jgi:hypothetical protein
MRHQKIINSLACEVANYLLDDREHYDYLEHCSENDLDPNDFLNNASLPGGHVYAKAKALIFHLEQLEQKQAEGEL